MTQIDEPNLDELANILLELTGSTPSGNFAVKFAYQKIKALIATQIQEARIDELELAVKSFEWGKGTDYLTDRIAWVKRNTPDHWAIHGDELPSASLTRALIDEDIEKCEQHIAEMEEELKKRRPNQPTKANKENDNATD